MDLLLLLNAVAVILGGILAVSGLILSKKPDAKRLIDALTPYQALIGVAMLGLGLVNFLRGFRYLTSGAMATFAGGTTLTMIAVAVLLGLLFGMPQIAKWIPGDSSAETKALELTRKIAGFQVLLGLIGIAASLVVLLYQLKIL